MDNEQKKFIPDESWMRLNYNKFNKELFGGSLGDCSLGLFTTGKGSQGGVLGWFKITNRGIKVKRSNRRMFYQSGWDEIWIDRQNFVQICRPRIELNGNYTATEESWQDVLVHEMCHYYNYMWGFCPAQGHGREFKEACSLVCSRSGGRFQIQRVASAETMKGMELDAEVKAKKDRKNATRHSNSTVVLSYSDNGEIELSIVSNLRVVDEIVNLADKSIKTGNRYNSSERGLPVKIVASNDQNLIDALIELGYRKIFRTYRFWSATQKLSNLNLNDYETKVIWQRPMQESVLMHIVESVINEFIDKEVVGDDDIVSIDTNMNLGIESPLEAENSDF